MKIKLSILFILTSSLLIANGVPADIGKSIPTQAKPTLNGIPPKPPAELIDELEDSKLVDYKKLSESLTVENAQLKSQINLKTNEVGKLNTKVSNLKIEKNSLTTEISEINSKLEKITNERNNLFSELQSKNNTISSLNKTNNELQIANEALSSTATNVGSIFNGWVYDPNLGWIYVSPSTMPYFYVTDVGWVYYEQGSTPRKFYYFNSSEWQIMDD